LLFEGPAKFKKITQSRCYLCIYGKGREGDNVISHTSSDDATSDNPKTDKGKNWKFILPKSPVVYAVSLLILVFGFWIIASTYPNAYAVIINGQEVALVEKPEIAEKTLKEVAAEIGKGKEIEIEAEITYRKVHAKEKPATPGELAQIFKSQLRFLCKAVAITVNGDPKVWVADEKIAERVLKKVKERYAPRGEVNLVRLDFEGEVGYQAGMVVPDKILDADKAAALLTTGTAKSVTHVVKEGDTLWTIARDNNMRVADLLKANPGLDEDDTLTIGDEIKLTKQDPLIHVVAEYKKTVAQSIPYETKYVYSNSLWRGSSRVTQKGEKGEKEVTYRVVTRDGVKIIAEPLESKVIKEPTTKIVARGTRVRTGAMVASRGDGGGGSLAWPLRGRITSRYGYRGREFHGAIDIDGVTGDPVRAAESGRVTYAGWAGGYGKTIIIDHGGGLLTKYAHCSQINVSVGEEVSRGQVIGRVGSTGRSTGSHLHFEVIDNGQRRNPLSYLR